jgi:hypothetical protein
MSEVLLYEPTACLRVCTDVHRPTAGPSYEQRGHILFEQHVMQGLLESKDTHRS